MERGKVLRDTSAGDGIVFVGGGQKVFSLERHWRSGVPPSVGMTVAVALSEAGEVESVTQVDETQLAKEQAQKALGALSTHGRQGALALVGRVGVRTLAALGVLLVAWLLLDTITVRLSARQGLGLTFHDLLKAVNAGVGLQGLGMLPTTGAGFYGLLMWVCLLLPLAPHFHANRHLVWGYCAPLAFMVALLAGAYVQFKRQISGASEMASGLGGMLGGAQSQAMVQKMMDEMVSRALSSVSFGPGLYVALLAAGFLAFVGVRRFLAGRAHA
ncbi:MAG: hypothetical protein QM772_03375 [Ottowia sp.]|uniref:hypothetical protein n=1 Tax=Ottowia sp. TaxID=1898956 RepID=UPI0039E654CC